MTGAVADIEPNGLALLIFGATFAACCLGFYTMIGMFPLHARPSSLSGVPGAALVIFNLVLLIPLVLGVAWFAHETIRWTSVVVFGGLIFLFIPSVFQVVPNQWRDSCGGLAVLGAIQIAALAVLFPPFQTLSAI